MADTDPFTGFLDAVETLRDGAVRVSAHTSSVSADAWITLAETSEPATD